MTTGEIDPNGWHTPGASPGRESWDRKTIVRSEHRVTGAANMREHRRRKREQAESRQRDTLT